MSVQLRNTLTSFTVVWVRDPALDAPERSSFESGEAGDAAYAEAYKAFADKVRVASETGDYRPVTRQGQVPTLFTFKAIRGKLLDRLRDSTMGIDERRGVIVRLALVGVQNATGCLAQLDRVADPDYPSFGKMLPERVIEELDQVDELLIDELAAEVARRSSNPPSPS